VVLKHVDEEMELRIAEEVVLKHVDEEMEIKQIIEEVELNMSMRRYG
jgi:hypothetical protein